MKVLKTEISQKYIDESGILRVKIIEGAHVDFESLKKDHETDFILTGHSNVLSLVDARSFFTIAPEAREYAKKEITDKSSLAMAVLTDKIGIRILINGFITINKPKAPIRIFTDEKKALEWLMSFKK